MNRLPARLLDTVTLGDFYIAGQRVAPGRYRLVGTQREIRLESEDILPGSLDGRVAVYVRQPITWAEMRARATDPDLIA